MSAPTCAGMLSSHVSPSPNITDSPVNRIVGRSGSTGSSSGGRDSRPDRTRSRRLGRRSVLCPVRAGDEGPAEPRIGSAARFFVGHEPSGRAQCTVRRTSSLAPSARSAAIDHVERPSRRGCATRRPMRGRATNSEAEANHGQHTTHAGFQQRVPVTRQEEGRQEVPVEPALIGGDRAEHERAAE